MCNVKGRDLARRLDKEPPVIRRSLRLIARLAGELNFPVYAVGGFVRDLILGIDDFDLDVVVEGDAIRLAWDLSRQIGADFTKHKRFGTATVATQDGLKLDLASAREEEYERPAALPKVRPGLIQDDLKRRDFSVNAMALDISASGYGRLVDFFGGQDDLLNRKIRVLHELSFIDDPTRILRAVRFEQRFDFKIEPGTLRLLKEARGRRMLEKVHSHRLRDELVLILKEPSPVKCLRRLNSLYGLKFIHPALEISAETFRLLERIEGIRRWFKDNFPAHQKHRVEEWLLYLAVLLEGLSPAQLKSALSGFAFHKNDIKKIIFFKISSRSVIKRLKKASSPSAVHKALFGLSCTDLLLILLRLPEEDAKAVKDKIYDYLGLYSGLRIHLSGEELKEMGMLPGPDFKKILRRLFYARLDGKFFTKEEELDYLKTNILKDRS